MNTLAVALSYLKRGWRPIPVPFKSKKPTLENWPDLRLSESELLIHFNGTPQNVGVLLGPASGGMVDVDLDALEAVSIASRFLTDSACFGRRSKRRSHHLYTTDPLAKTAKFKDVDGTMLVEIRGDRHQTIFPPSLHPSGEEVFWEKDVEPTRVSGQNLQEHVSTLAAAAVIARHWPAEGSRQEAALALAGGLLRAGWNLERVGKFIYAVSYAAGDEESSKRASSSWFTEKRLSEKLNATGWPHLAALITPEVVRKAAGWLGITAAQVGDNKSEESGRQQPQAARLIRRAETVALFNTPEGGVYGTVPVGDHFETWSLKSKSFRLWLIKRYYDEEGEPPNNQALQNALGVIQCQAIFEGPTLEIHTRLAEYEGVIYLDLADAKWRAVEIRSDGWAVVDRPPVRFKRTRGMLPLPGPTRGGSIQELEEFINVESREDWILLVSWIIAALRPRGPYPVLTLNGEQGSAKSSVSRIIKALIDPNKAPLRGEPRDDRDLMIAASNSWILALDNLSHMRNWLSDSICRLATGGGFATRELFSDDEEIIFDARRPVIINGIEEVITRSDLLDRALLLYLPSIPESKRRAESSFWADFESRRPQLLGALLDVVSVALRNVDSVKPTRLPRLADFVVWVSAAESALGLNPGEFMSVYERNQERANTLALEASALAAALMSFMAGRMSWKGTATELLEELNRISSESARRQLSWPKGPRALSGSLRRLAPNLRAAGVAVTLSMKGHAGRRFLRLEKLENFAPPPPPS
jgi:hypothetical protein